MAKSRVRYSPEALNDLDEIWSYISNELQNPTSASETIDNIMDTIDGLNDFPEMGPTLSSITGIESVFRFLVCKSYMAFYHLNGRIASIDRILYGKNDYIRILFEKEV